MNQFIEKIRQSLARKTAQAIGEFNKLRQAIEQAFEDAERLAREQFLQAERELELAATAAAARFQDTIDSLRDDAVGRAAGVSLDIAEDVSVAPPPPRKTTYQAPEPVKVPTPQPDPQVESEPDPEPPAYQDDHGSGQVNGTQRRVAATAAQSVGKERPGLLPEQPGKKRR